MEKVCLSVEGLTVQYDKLAVLWDLNLEIPQGKMVGIVGPNGAGKSTLFKALIGLLRPISGKVLFFQQPFKKLRKSISYIPQRSSIDWDFPITAFEVVLMGAYGKLGYFRRPRRSDRQAAMRALTTVGMKEYADRQIGQLSGGQQQRLFLARALLQEAEILLMDEPFVGVDLATEKMMIDVLKQLKEEGKTIFMIHHDLTNIRSYFDWVVLLNRSIIGSGPVSAVFTTKNIARTFGKGGNVLEEIARISEHTRQGIT